MILIYGMILFVNTLYSLEQTHTLNILIFNRYLLISIEKFISVYLFRCVRRELATNFQIKQEFILALNGTIAQRSAHTCNVLIQKCLMQ